MTDISLREAVLSQLKSMGGVLSDLTRKEAIKESVENKEVFVSETGALALWGSFDSTGRSPKDTYIVKNSGSEKKVDWSFAVNIPMDPELFEDLVNDALETLKTKEKVYVSDKAVGADSQYALPVKTITDTASTILFADNMFRETPPDIDRSVFFDEEFIILVLPGERIDQEKYKGKVGDKAIVMDFDRKIGLVYGSFYCGSVKKTLFTVMNYLLPDKDVLPLHCGANISKDGKETALFSGLSGTGKTTLSTDQNRPLIGDDEHGWSDNGIFNMEGGCYAKLIGFSKEKEPEIAKAAFTKRDVLENGVLIENALMYPNGEFDFDDGRLTDNSRVSYPLKFIENADLDSLGSHPTKIVFLTADANGVLPPVARLDKSQAMFWFLMGYTSKLAGTEIGVTEPITAFSRFFGGPFMPRNPGDYTDLLGKKMEEHGVEVYLVNTGWSGGPYGEGERMDITVSRAVVTAILNGDLTDVEYEEDKRFKILIPKTCPNIDSNILNPRNTWKDGSHYDKRADKLAKEFAEFFDKNYAGSVSEEVAKACPGK